MILVSELIETQCFNFHASAHFTGQHLFTSWPSHFGNLPCVFFEKLTSTWAVSRTINTWWRLHVDNVCVCQSQIPAAIRVKTSEKVFKAKRATALSQRSIWSLSAVLQCTRLAESYLTISCSIHERAIMYKKGQQGMWMCSVSAWRAPAKPFPTGTKDVVRKKFIPITKT